jgi:hypothetical protein
MLPLLLYVRAYIWVLLVVLHYVSGSWSCSRATGSTDTYRAASPGTPAFQRIAQVCTCTHSGLVKLMSHVMPALGLLYNTQLLLTLVRLKLMEIICENSGDTSQRTQSMSIIKTRQWMLLRKLIAIYCDNHMAHTYAMWQNVELRNVTVGSTYW